MISVIFNKLFLHINLFLDLWKWLFFFYAWKLLFFFNAWRVWFLHLMCHLYMFITSSCMCVFELAIYVSGFPSYLMLLVPPVPHSYFPYILPKLNTSEYFLFFPNHTKPFFKWRPVSAFSRPISSHSSLITNEGYFCSKVEIKCEEYTSIRKLVQKVSTRFH